MRWNVNIGAAAVALAVMQPAIARAADISMKEAVAKALDQSPAVRAARHRFDSAVARQRAARAMAGLQVSTGLVAGAASRDGTTTVAGADPALMAMLGRDIAVAHETAAMLPIHTGGKLAAEVRRMQAEAEAAGAELHAVQAETAAAVRAEFLRASLAAEELRVAEADERAARAMAENVRASVDAGKAIEAVYLRAVARVREAEGAVRTARADRTAAIIAMAAAMGLDTPVDIAPADQLDLTPSFQDLESALKAVRDLGPAIRAARHMREAARAAVAADHGDERPQIYAYAMGGWAAMRGMRGQGGASLGVTVALPLFDGDLRRRRRQSDEALARASDEDLRAAQIGAEAEVRSAWTMLEAAAARLKAAEAGVEAAQAASDVLALRVANQKSVLVEQIDALAALQSARLAAARARLDHAMACITIDRVTGRY